MYNKGHSTSRVLPSTFVGVDTVRLWVRSFTVADNSAFKVRTDVEASTGQTEENVLYQTSNGLVYGDKAFLNAASFSATVHSPEALYVQASLPKQLDTHNAVECRGADIDLALTALEAALWRHGIATDLREAYVSRLDLCRTVTLDRPVKEYSGVIRQLRYPRMDRTDYYSGGARWGNTKHQISLYDKGLEQTGSPSNEARLEYRLIRGEAVKRYTKVTVAGDLTCAAAGLDDTYAKVTNTLLDWDTDMIDLDRLDLKDKDVSGFHALLKALIQDGVHGATTVAQQVVCLAEMTPEQREAFEEAILEQKSKQEAYRVRKKWKSLQKYVDLYKEESTTVTVLYSELKDAFVQDPQQDQ